MARRITIDDIRLINESYYRTKSYAATARETGWSAATVSKYVDKQFTPAAALNVKKVLVSDLPVFSARIFTEVEDYGELCVLSDAEKTEISDLWRELSI